MTKPTACIDFDAMIFRSCCATEDRSIEVTNKITQETFVYKNRTQFFGAGKKISGVLEELNKLRSTPYTKDDFLIVDKIDTQPFFHAKSIMNKMVKRICEQLGTTKWFGFVAGEGNFRLDECRIIPYKGNRTLPKPVHYYEMVHYLESIGVEKVNGKEVDDEISTICFQSYQKYKKSRNNKDLIVGVVCDKDYLGNSGVFWNFLNEGVVQEVDGFGTLINDEGSIKGTGRLFKYFQILSNDTSDGYSANFWSDVKWGSISAYKALKECKTDKECWQKIVNTYKILYPETKTITNHRQELVQFDWLDILQEIVMFVHLQRWDSDRLKVTDILDRLEIAYES